MDEFANDADLARGGNMALSVVPTSILEFELDWSISNKSLLLSPDAALRCLLMPRMESPISLPLVIRDASHMAVVEQDVCGFTTCAIFGSDARSHKGLVSLRGNFRVFIQ